MSFIIRRLRTKIESLVRKTALKSEYFIWKLFIRKAKPPTEMKEVLVVDLTKAWGDNFLSFLVFNNIAKENPNIKFTLLFWDNFVEEAKKGYPLLNWIKYDNLLQDKINKTFDVAVIIWMSDKNINILPAKFKVGAEQGGFSDFGKYLKLSKKLYPRYEHKILQKFKIFNLAGLKSQNMELELPLSFYYTQEAKKLMEELNLSPEDSVIFINPEAGTSNRARNEGKYPSHDWDKFPELIDYLLDNTNSKILITGTVDLLKGKYGERIISLVGKTSLFGLAELMRIYKDNGLVISLDTSTPHLGDAVGIRTINLMGPYDPKLIGTWTGVNMGANSSCLNCRKYYCPERNNICMKNLNLQEVVNVISEVYSSSKSKAC